MMTEMMRVMAVIDLLVLKVKFKRRKNVQDRKKIVIFVRKKKENKRGNIRKDKSRWGSSLRFLII